VRLAKALLLAATAIHAVAYLVAAPEHVVDRWWPAHARFHVMQALLWAVGFDAVVALIVLGPFARGERWARAALLVAAVFLHGAYFIAFAAGGWPTNLSAHVSLGASTLLFVFGLALGWRAEPEGSHG
jgi:hypothetical protein